MKMNRQNVVIANTRTMSSRNGKIPLGQTRQASAIAVNSTIEHSGVAPTMLERFSNIVWRSEKPEEDGSEGKGRKIPKGFEKLLRPNKKTEDSKPEEKQATKESETEKEKAEQSEEEDGAGEAKESGAAAGQARGDAVAET